MAVTLRKPHGSLGGKAFLITGPRGIGKSTFARLIAQDVCYEDIIVELDASGITPAAIVELERSLRTLAIGDKPSREVTINECHALRKNTIRQLLVTLERIPEHAVYTLTTTNLGQQVLFDGIDASPLVSRCIEFRLEANRCLERFAERAMQIAETQSLGGAAFSEYVDVAKPILRQDLAAARCAYREQVSKEGAPLNPDFLSATDSQGRVIDFHALRYTCGGWLMHMNTEIKTLQKIMRHSSAQLTLDVYGDFYPGGDWAAVLKMPNTV